MTPAVTFLGNILLLLLSYYNILINIGTYFKRIIQMYYPSLLGFGVNSCQVCYYRVMHMDFKDTVVKHLPDKNIM